MRWRSWGGEVVVEEEEEGDIGEKEEEEVGIGIGRWLGWGLDIWC